MRARIAILGSGEGSNAKAICEYAAQATSPYDVGLILTTSEAAGICNVAARYGIPCECIDGRSDVAEQIVTMVQRYRIDLLALAGFMRLLPATVIEFMGGRVLNIHPALLPKYGGKGMYGLHVHRAVLGSGDAITGATVHVVTPQYDEGQVILQQGIQVPEGITPEGLQVLVKEVEHQIYPEAISVFIHNT